MFSFNTAGESHGEAILAILEGVPFGLPVDVAAIDAELARRQRGFGRSSRQQIERDRVEVVAGVYQGRTTGAPLVLRVANRDRTLDELPPVRRPRPGHADLSGALRFSTDDARPVLERASARETAGRVAAGAVTRQLLAALGVTVDAFVESIGGVGPVPIVDDANVARAARDACDDLRVTDPGLAEEMRERIRAAGREGDTLGGAVRVVGSGIPAGLGTLVRWERRLDARIGAAMLSIPSAKGVEVGEGFRSAGEPGSAVHDAIGTEGGPFDRPTNRSGGLEGGMTSGAPLVVRVAFKPIATLGKALPSVDLRTGRVAEPDHQRSDVCAVPAASVVAEAMLLIVLTEAALERYGGATYEDFVGAFRAQEERRDRRFPFRAGGDPAPD